MNTGLGAEVKQQIPLCDALRKRVRSAKRTSRVFARDDSAEMGKRRRAAALKKQDAGLKPGTTAGN